MLASDSAKLKARTNVTSTLSTNSCKRGPCAGAAASPTRRGRTSGRTSPIRERMPSSFRLLWHGADCNGVSGHLSFLRKLRVIGCTGGVCKKK